MSKAELLFAPLGGCREIGMNLNAYAYGPPGDLRWIVVDVGVTFPDDTVPGVDLIMADPAFLEERADSIEAIILTHAHEDHIGAIGWLWPKLRAPVYATPFTAYLVREKLRECGLDDEEILHVVNLRDRRKFGPFDVEFVTLTHSIPEPNGLAIRTPLGTILHTGDWKIDPDPLIGSDFDEAKVRELGEEGVLAMVCDSTNVFEEGESGSEGGVAEELEKVISGLTGRVAVTSFASNVARVHATCRAAQKAGRVVCLVGRSMLRISDAARSVGMLTQFDFVSPEEAADMPDDNVLYLCTGSQGERNAALAKIARGDHPHVRLGPGDTVLFSSRVIPGNEKPIGEIQNMLAERGVRLITGRGEHIHVSGHPCRDELRRMYQWARPRIAVPVHGERRHVLEHARFARTMQVSETVTPDNGQIVRLAPGPAEIVDEAPAGRLHLEGRILTPHDSAGLWERRRISYNGYVNVSLVIARGALADTPAIMARGLSEADGSAADESLEAIDEAVEAAARKLSRDEIQDDERLERVFMRAARRACEQTFGKRPLIDVVIHRI